jgi:hypothetical protein
MPTKPTRAQERFIQIVVLACLLSTDKSDEFTTKRGFRYRVELTRPDHEGIMYGSILPWDQRINMFVLEAKQFDFTLWPDGGRMSKTHEGGRLLMDLLDSVPRDLAAKV